MRLLMENLGRPCVIDLCIDSLVHISKAINVISVKKDPFRQKSWDISVVTLYVLDDNTKTRLNIFVRWNVTLKSTHKPISQEIRDASILIISRDEDEVIFRMIMINSFLRLKISCGSDIRLIFSPRLKNSNRLQNDKIVDEICKSVEICSLNWKSWKNLVHQRYADVVVWKLLTLFLHLHCLIRKLPPENLRHLLCPLRTIDLVHRNKEINVVASVASSHHWLESFSINLSLVC